MSACSGNFNVVDITVGNISAVVEAGRIFLFVRWETLKSDPQIAVVLGRFCV